MRTTWAIVGLTIALGWLGASCSVKTVEPDPDEGSGGGSVSSSAMTVGVTVAASSSTGAGGNGGGDESTSCSNALPLEPFDNNAGGTTYEFDPGTINEPSDQDFFHFDANAGDWVEVRTVANPEDIDGLPDTVLTLYAPGSASPFAFNDDSPSGGPDSEIVFRAPSTGTFCVKVHDANPDAGGASHQYRLLMIPIDFEIYTTQNEDTGDNGTLENAQEITFNIGNSGMLFSQFAGTLDSEADIDVFKFTAPAGTLAIDTDFTPSGSSGWGSTGGPGVINIYEQDGAATPVLHAVLDYQDESDGFSKVPATPGLTYLFEVHYPTGEPLGDNDFYYLIFSTSDNVNDQEMKEAENGDSTGADIAFGQPDGSVKRHYIGGRIASDSDVDWWSFQADAGDEIAVACGSRRNGSGLAAFDVAIYDSSATTLLQSDSESLTKDLYWSSSSNSATKPGITVSSTGTHFVKFSGTTAEPTARHYMCGIHVTTP